jgi:hypothetical protein
MTKNRLLIGAILLVVSLAFMGCDIMFTTPMFGAKPREYEQKNINLNMGNLDTWQKAAVGNPALALALAQKIRDMDMTNMSPEEKAAFLNAGIGFAIEASDFGKSLLSNMGKIGEIFDGQDISPDSFQDLFDSLKGNSGAAAVLAEIVSKGIDEDGNFIEGFEPSSADAAQAVIILTLALVSDITENIFDENNDFNLDVLESFGVIIDEDGNVSFSEDGVDPGLVQKAKALVAFLNYIVDDPDSDSNPLTSVIKSVFSLAG